MICPGNAPVFWRQSNRCMILRSLRKASALALAFVTASVLGLPAAAPEKAQFVGSYKWKRADHKLGGFSGIELSSDGKSFTAISDQAGIVSGTLHRDNGRISDVVTEQKGHLRDERGRRLKGKYSDAEGLAVRSDGRIFVSFEHQHRVWAYLTLKAAAWLPRPKQFKALQPNSGLEALAVDPKDRLYAIPERSGKLTRPFPVWRYAKGKWTQPFALRREGGFLPVGADFDTEGNLYLLERAFTGFGFKSRVRRFFLDDDAVTAEETLLETAILQHDNLEGLSVWKDADGDIRLTMISDDNFNDFQRTEFVEYRVTRR